MWQRRNGNGNGHRQQDLASLIDVYLLRCEVEGKSTNTIKAYGESLRRFTEIAWEEGFPEDVTRITPSHLYTYLGRYTNYSLETRHRYFREVRCFFNWLVEAGYLQKTPFRSLRNVRLPQKIVQPFSPDDYFAISIVIIYFAAAIWGLLSDSNWGLIAYFGLTTFLWLYLPWSKVSHYLYWPFTRFYHGFLFGRRGVTVPKLRSITEA